MKFIFILFLLISFLNARNYNINLTKEEQLFLENNQPLRLHNEAYWPPYNFNENNTPKGFVIDYMNLIASKLGIKVEYISGHSWNEFMEMLKNDQIDAIINISKNKQREEFFEFTNVYHIAANAIYVKKGNEDIDSLEKLEGKTIVMPKGFFAQQLLEQYYPQIKQIHVDDSVEALRLLSLGKADATIDKKNVLDYIISTKNVSGVVATNYVNDDRLVSYISIAVSKNKSILKSILNKAQDSITDKEMLDLKRKWFGNNELVNNKSFLTKEEKSYISNNNIIKMCNILNLKPIEFLENEKVQGINIDLLNLIGKKLNIRFENIIVKDSATAEKYLEDKLCDILPIISKNINNKNILLSNPLVSYKLAIITQKGKPVVQDIDEVLNQTMAKKSNSENLDILKSNYPNINIIETKSDYDTFEAVNSNKVYYAIEPLPVVAYYMSKFAFNDIFISRYTDILLTSQIAISKDNMMLYNIFNRAIEQINENEHNEIFNKWTNFSIKTPFDYSIIWKISLVIFIILLILAYRQSILNKHNKTLRLINNEIEKKNRQIAKQKELFEKLYSKSSDGVLLLKNKKITDCNEAATKILQYSKDELIGKYFYEISPKFQPDGQSSNLKSINKLNEALKNGISNFEWMHKSKDHKKLWIEIVLTSIEINNNLVIHTVIRDINKRKEMEKELEVLTYNLEEKIKKEIEKNEEKTAQLIQQSRFVQMGEMISMIAHQWRQPLTAITATTNNLLLRNILNKEISKDILEKELKLITEYTQHLSFTIDDFRNFFKSDKEKVEAKIEDIIEKAISIIKTSFESKNIKLITNYRFNQMLTLYTTEVQQVILILLKNAEDALIENEITNKKIKILTYKENDFVIIEIQDNAGGIAQDIIYKIFDPYFSTKKAKEGMGIGLYMSKIIINDHCKGEITASNNQDGAIFKIKLPLDIS
ncbi:transporter substrate-binding domain-containing protein [Arcobacter sp. s6]|uniref:transporter substrate-binding domain-containing protein n=1 Tax=Arcobacter sp. s6 TaxID=3230363 RepID=UPI0034A0140D